MRKLIIGCIICVVVALVFCGCTNANKKEPPIGYDNESANNRYTISYNLGDLSDNFADNPTNAEAGEVVEIRTHILYDADLHVYEDGQEIEKIYSDGSDGYWVYTFTMPNKNVEITAKPFSKSEIYGSETNGT